MSKPSKKNAREVRYFVKRIRTEKGLRYYVHHENGGHQYIQKKKDGWYAEGLYHKTLRDAIVYCAYGV